MIRSACQAFLILCCYLFAGNVSTLAVAADSKIPQDLIGLWAHTKADCLAKSSGKLDAQDNVTNSNYEFVGFCKSGMDLLYQPIYCTPTKIDQVKDSFAFSMACRVKDYPPYPVNFGIAKTGAGGGIHFDQKDFGDAEFSVDGDYIRCTPTYVCETGSDR